MASGGVGDLDNCVGIEGGTDGTKIGNASDRLKVDIDALPGGNEPIIPADETTYFTDYVKNGGSPDLNVNGATTPVEFSMGPSGSDTWYLTEIVIMIQDGGNLDATDYGAIASGLTNGLLIEHSLVGTDYQIANLKINVDLAVTFSNQALEGTSQGFLNDSNLFIGAFKVEPEITLNASNSDVLKVTVRDNLTALTMHRLAYRAWMIP